MVEDFRSISWCHVSPWLKAIGFSWRHGQRQGSDMLRCLLHRPRLSRCLAWCGGGFVSAPVGVPIAGGISEPPEIPQHCPNLLCDYESIDGVPRKMMLSCGFTWFHVVWVSNLMLWMGDTSCFTCGSSSHVPDEKPRSQVVSPAVMQDFLIFAACAAVVNVFC